MVNFNPLIEIIIPNWNGEKMLDHCLLSLEKQTQNNFAVTVVDNGSEDESLGLLAKKFPKVKVIELDHNTGFSFAVNRGIAQANSPWLLLLNNDMEVAPDCLENLERAIKKYNKHDLFALKMLDYQQRNIIDGAGDAVFRGGFGYRLGNGLENNRESLQDCEVFGACAGAALYSKHFFLQTGMFDPDFFAYLEDVDLNMRAQRIGMRCMFVASAVVYHIGSASSGSKINEVTVRLTTRNSINMLAKNYSIGMALRFLPAIVICQCSWAIFCLKKWMFLSYCRGLYQGLRGMAYFNSKKKVYLAAEKKVIWQQFAKSIKLSEQEAINSIIKKRKKQAKGCFLLHCYNKIFF